MAKMVKSAQGQMIDCDLLKLQSQTNSNVAAPVDIVDQSTVAARRQQRVRLDAARKLLEKAQEESTAPTPVIEVTPTKAKNARVD